MAFSRVAVYFVASPLQYMVARAIAGHFEPGAKQVLIWYKKGVEPVVIASDWDEAFYMPWPRREPLPGKMGRHKRLLENLDRVATAVGRCDEIVLHSAVFDTEAINYFIRGLPPQVEARSLSGRILPDGLISIRRYPLSRWMQLAQWSRSLRQIFEPRLKYTRFSGDRIGSDAVFCDRIYVLPGLPNEYPPEKVVCLPPLARALPPRASSMRRALVVGQSLTDTRILSNADCDDITRELHEWLVAQGFEEIDYKGHPKDPKHELYAPGDQILTLNVPLESWMSQTYYDAVVGVRSSALLFARQIYPSSTRVVAFGWDRIRFKSQKEAQDMLSAFKACGVEIQ